MNKQKRNTIISFTLKEYFKSKFFIIFNIISLLSMLIGFNFNSIKQTLNIPEKEIKYKIEVIDNSNILYKEFENNFFFSGDYEILKVTENNYTKENITAENIIIEITEKEKEHFKVTVTSMQSLKDDIKQAIYNTLTGIQNSMYAKDYNIENEDIELILKKLDFETVFLSVVSEGYLEKMFIKYMSTAVTMFVAMLVFSKIGNDIAQEKQSKSSEYILTTVSSKEYLYAKVIGNMLFVILQFLLMIVYLFIGLGLASLFKLSSSDVGSISVNATSSIISKENLELIAILFIYNILTLFLLSFIQGALSAKSTSIQDASNSSVLIITIYTILFIATMGVIDQYTTPNVFLYLISMVPVVSSFFVPAMVITGQSNYMQIGMSLVFLIVALPITFNYSQRKFKEGILNYSKSKKKDAEKENDENKILEKRNFSQIGSVVGISIIIFLGANIIISSIAQTFLSGYLQDVLASSDILLITQIIVSLLSLYFSYKYVMAHVEKPKQKRKNLKISPIKIMAIVLGLIAFLQIALTYVFELFSLNYDVTAIFELSSSPSVLTKVLFVLAIAVIPAIFEELFCRKAIISLARPQGRAFAIILSSVLFGLIHMNLQQFIFAFLVGLLLAIMYEYTNDLKYTIVIHFINNFISTLPIILGKSDEGFVLIIYAAFILFALIAIIDLLISKKQKNAVKEYALKVKSNLIQLKNLQFGYLYLFYDFMFDISILALLLLSIYQQNIIKLFQ